MDQLLISIIIPVYNSEVFLPATLSSALNQTYQNIEIVLVNDGSTDNSLSICEHFKEKDDRIRIVSKPNGGVSSARNFGLDIAHGDYVYFMDSDDIASPYIIETLSKLLQDHNCDCAIVHYSTDILSEPNWSEKPIIMNSHDAVRELHRGVRFKGQLWTKLFKKELIGKKRFSDQYSINEDMVFVQSYFLDCERIVYKGVSLYNYRTNSTSAYHGVFKPTDLSAIAACVAMKRQGMIKFPDLEHYYDKSILVSEMFIATKFLYDKHPDQKIIKERQTAIINLWNKETLNIYSNSAAKRVKIYAFIKDWRLYFLLVKMEKCLLMAKRYFNSKCLHK